MAAGPSTEARRQPISHGLLQMRPKTAGKAMSFLIVVIASRNSLPPICFSMSGISMCAGQANRQGARQSPT